MGRPTASGMSENATLVVGLLGLIGLAGFTALKHPVDKVAAIIAGCASTIRRVAADIAAGQIRLQVIPHPAHSRAAVRVSARNASFEALGGDEARLAAARAELLGGGFARITVELGNDNARAFGGEASCHRPADPVAAAGDHRAAARETSYRHGIDSFKPLVSSWRAANSTACQRRGSKLSRRSLSARRWTSRRWRSIISASAAAPRFDSLSTSEA